MINDDGALITSDFGHSLESVVGKLTIADTPRARVTWDLFRTNPTLFQFAVGYTENLETGEKQLMEISIILRGKDEQTTNRKSTL